MNGRSGTRRRLWLAAAWSAVLLLWVFIKAWPPDGRERPGSGLFAGRFHPLVLHLPIALILLVPLFEWLGRAEPRSHLRRAAGFVLGLAVAAALLAAFDGWLLARDGGYQGRTLEMHLWGGVWFATVCVAAASVRAPDGTAGPGRGRAYGLSLCAALGLMVWASHNGGSLSHGPTFLTEYMPARLRRLLRVAPSTAGPVAGPAAKGPPAKTLYDARIQPILDRSCVSCHGPSKVKASLRLDTYAALMKGGDSGQEVVPWVPDNSELLRRVTLPPDDDDFMPNNGKNLLTPEEKTLLKDWIAAGASNRQPLLTSSLK